MARKIKHSQNKSIMFNCPGCNITHVINFHPDRMWTVTGTDENPTFSPSVLVKSGKDLVNICHSFVNDGRIQFLDDSTHALKGQTVEIPDWDGVKCN